MDAKLLRIEEVAGLTGVPMSTLRFWRLQSKPGKPIGPKSAKFGRRIVYREADVKAWVDEQFAKAG